MFHTFGTVDKSLHHNLQVKDVSHPNVALASFTNKYFLFAKQFHALFYPPNFFSTIIRPTGPPKLLHVDFYCRLF